jgi:putative transposase
MIEILTRRRLPHWYRSGAAYFVTYRLAGTLSGEALKRLDTVRQQFENAKPLAGETRTQQRLRMHKQWFAAYDGLLDQQTENAFLSDPRVAAMARENLYHHNGIKFHLLAFCVMPNHVHLVLQPVEIAEPQDEPRTEIGDRDDGISPLSKIMHSLKSYIAHEANRLLSRQGAFWQRESYDHWIRDDDELERIVLYIQQNPVKAGLVSRPQDWYWCSCHDRYLRDGEPTAWLR